MSYLKRDLFALFKVCGDCVSNFYKFEIIDGLITNSFLFFVIVEITKASQI